jgi:hypothetical protein
MEEPQPTQIRLLNPKHAVNKNGDLISNLKTRRTARRRLAQQRTGHLWKFCKPGGPNAYTVGPSRLNS